MKETNAFLRSTQHSQASSLSRENNDAISSPNNNRGPIHRAAGIFEDGGGGYPRTNSKGASPRRVGTIPSSPGELVAQNERLQEELRRKAQELETITKERERLVLRLGERAAGAAGGSRGGAGYGGGYN